MKIPESSTGKGYLHTYSALGSGGSNATVRIQSVVYGEHSSIVDFDSNGYCEDIISARGYRGDNELVLPTPDSVKPGYTFTGWYTAATGGTKIGNGGDVVAFPNAAQTTYYAHAEGNTPVFNPGSFSQAFATTATTHTFNPATNGTGEYNYTIRSQTKYDDDTATVSYFSIPTPTNNVLAIDANTPAGAYAVTIRATDAETGKYKGTKIKVTITKIDNPITISSESGSITYPGTDNFTVSNAEGTVTVSSDNNDIATASISDNVVTVTAGTTAGTATITVTAAGDNNYNAGSKTYTATVSSGTILFTATIYKGTYDGNPHGITLNVSTPGCTIEYGTSEGVYDLDVNPTYTDAGYYTTYYRISKPGYTTVTGSNSVSISEKSVTIPTQSGTLTYNATSQSPSWNNYDSSIMTLSGTTSGTEAGNYTATFILKDKNNYKWASDTTDDQIVNWTIATNSVNNTSIIISGGTGSSSSDFRYTGSAVNPTITVKIGNNVVNSANYTVTYSNSATLTSNLIRVGVVTVTITGRGSLTSSGTTTFTIGGDFLELMQSTDYLGMGVSTENRCLTCYQASKNYLLNSTSAYLLSDFQSINDEDVVAARTRYEAWARNRGDANPYNKSGSSLYHFDLKVDGQIEPSNIGLIIAVISAASLLILSSTLVYQFNKKRRNK